MSNHSLNADTVESNSQYVSLESYGISNPNVSLDLLLEGRALNLHPSQNTSDQYLKPLVIDTGAGSTPGEANASGKDNDPSTEQKPDSDINRVLIPTDLRGATSSIFDSVDEDKNGFLTQEELAVAMQDNSYSGQAAQAVAALYFNVEGLSNLSNDEIFFEYGGITHNDIATFDSVAERHLNEVNTVVNARDWVRDRFSVFDTNQNNKLSWNEIETGLDSKNLKPGDRQMMDYFEANYDQVGAAHDDKDNIWKSREISREDINSRRHDVFLADKIVPSIILMALRTYKSQQPEISRKLYSDPDHPERSITAEAIKQGKSGDCYFLAAVAAVANLDPESINRMIIDNRDGTYTVAFPDDRLHPVTVNEPTDAELGSYNAGSSSGIWVSVLEKAYGKYLKYQGAEGLTDVDAAGNGGQGGDPSNALRTLTGRNFNSYVIASITDQSLIALLGSGNPVVINTPTKEIVGLPWDRHVLATKTEDNFPLQHAYTLMGLKWDGKGKNYLFTIRNPWGIDEDTTGGTTDITLEQFKKNFEVISVEVPPFADRSEKNH